MQVLEEYFIILTKVGSSRQLSHKKRWIFA